ncbi:MAG: hypothetical protein ABFQ65_00310, partial [Nanoarchaeota archaeon]
MKTKIILPIFFLMILSLSIFVSAENSSICSDSDGGLNYDVKGEANKEGFGSTEDFCVNDIKLSEALCNNDGNPANAQYDCPNGCSNGAC